MQNPVKARKYGVLGGGELTDGELPEYGWLNASELPKDYVRKDYIVQTYDENVYGNKSFNDNGFSSILPWLVDGLVILAAVCFGLIAAFRKKRSD